MQHTQNLVLQIFGMIAFNYDLQTLDYDHKGKQTNELTQALSEFLSAWETIYYIPRTLSIIYLKFNRRYQQARKTIQRHLSRMIEQELNESSESRAERKRTSLIASLLNSLQENEKAEARKSEEEKNGNVFFCGTRTKSSGEIYRVKNVPPLPRSPLDSMHSRKLNLTQTHE